jgi:hypothetical protein
MDYTNHPEVNKQPDDSNYQFLYDLYGSVPTQQSETVSGSATAAPTSPIALRPGGRKVKNGGTRGRNLHEELPHWILEKWRSLDQELNNHAHNSERQAGWRLLEESEHLETHEIDIGHGYSIRVNKFLVLEDS